MNLFSLIFRFKFIFDIRSEFPNFFFVCRNYLNNFYYISIINNIIRAFTSVVSFITNIKNNDNNYDNNNIDSKHLDIELEKFLVFFLSFDNKNIAKIVYESIKEKVNRNDNITTIENNKENVNKDIIIVNKNTIIVEFLNKF